jgi:energy-coupling factor transporter ATP-binding protein EcfA2
MAKYFNVNGTCKPNMHYMVNLEPKLKKIKVMIDNGQYFTINRARQYGKTTILRALSEYLKHDYTVISLDFQKMSSSDFEYESAFVRGLAREIVKRIRHTPDIPEQTEHQLLALINAPLKQPKLAEIFDCFSDWCESSSKPIVLLIDEVDTAANNQIFLDFLAQLRAAYLDNDITPTFQSVILASVYDIRNIRRKLRPDEEHKMNSPWNIAAKFRVNMSFSPEEIAGMLKEYEQDHRTGMDIETMSALIYARTSGYPYLVSSLCKYLDEEIADTAEFPDKGQAWTKYGLIEAEKILVTDNNTLFQSLTAKLSDYPELRYVLHDLLFTGRPIPYVPQNPYIDAAAMFGFIKNDNGTAVISNRIFESVLYNLFISEEFATSKMYDAGNQDRNQFVVNGHLDVRRILEKFVEAFNHLYGDADETFLEDTGRRYFMLFLKPIINGTGNCYVEPETRNRERMDLVIDYRGEQHICELKIWRGNAYNERGEEQLSGYLDYFGLKKGYMLSFNFNKKKSIGVKEVHLGDRVLIEAVV